MILLQTLKTVDWKFQWAIVTSSARTEEPIDIAMSDASQNISNNFIQDEWPDCWAENEILIFFFFPDH